MSVVGLIKKVDSILVNGIKIRKVLITCPKCGEDRWISAYTLKRPRFSGLCMKCTNDNNKSMLSLMRHPSKKKLVYCKQCNKEIKRYDANFCSRKCFNTWIDNGNGSRYPIWTCKHLNHQNRYSNKGLDKRLEALRRWRGKYPELLREHNRRIAPLAFRAIYQKAPYIEDGYKFQSHFEMDVYRELKKLNMPIRVQIPIGISFIDFQINRTFIEAHPFAKDKRNPLDNKTFEEYYNGRRKILDNNGYQDYKLKVIIKLGEMVVA